jgi:hypothetical protein
VSAVAAITLIGVLWAPAASANTLQANCSNFGTQLSAAGAGDTIVLTGLCTAAQATYTLPATANLTIQGASSGTNGFDGTGVATPALSSAATPNDPNGLTIRGLTFENYALSAAVRVNTTKVGNPYAVVLDTFTNNHAPSGNGGGLDLEVHSTSTSCTLGGPNITMTANNFAANSAPGNSGPTTGGGGGGAMVTLECTSGSPSLLLSNNTFTGNTVAGATGTRNGGGLWLGLGANIFSLMKRIALTQSANLFQGNSVTGSSGNFVGGGEFTFGADVTSTGDRFIGNSLSGSSNAASSEGGGLSTLAAQSCTNPPGDTSTFTNMVATGNSIAAPAGSGASEGGGVYVGCSFGGGYDLTLDNTTITANQANGPGAVSGIDGETSDHLHLQNSIVAGNAGGTDLGGFGVSPGGNVTAANSDVCAIGSGVPFTGPGNLCAAPALAGAGTGDVHETAASPTIDAGSNAFVSTATDVFGAPRVVQGKPGGGATVDIGAAEAPSDAFTIGNVKGKTLEITVSVPGTAQVDQAGGTGTSASAAAKKKKKKQKLLNTSTASGGPGTITIPLRLTKPANKQLKSKGKLKLTVTVTFAPTNGVANPQTASLTIKNKKKKK